MQCFWCKDEFDETFALEGDSKSRQFCRDCLASISNDPIDVAQQRRHSDPEDLALESALEDRREGRELVCQNDDSRDDDEI